MKRRIGHGSIVEDFAGRKGEVFHRHELRLEGAWVVVRLDSGETRHYRPRELTVIDGALRYPAE